ncbi:diacylglycerol/lipid kinase family protein [Actinomycetospora chibensis]|uniref:Diacylglycerol/lipid kinase family protein n=1 Tax=Actinomycetospora chibensis TaxID=663606 RepID=A0ABV9RF27_9PSEU|nr:diacylglycerol kinase family protein [Actinomycetospora chibensis]MDD7927181.1 diacylglycerol kinase family protein [Actinomycetospora chibensis]
MSIDGPSAASPTSPPAPVRPGRRVAAGAALLAALAALAVVVVRLLDAPLLLAAGVLMVVVAVLAGWSALIHRGARRWLGIAIAAVAVVALVVVLDPRSLVRIAVVIGLLAVAIATARYSLGDQAADPPSMRRRVGPATHGVLLMNPRSGGGKVGRFHLEEEARRRGITPIVLHPGDDLRALAEHAVAGGADVLGMAGGDGSQALVADVARRHDVALVCVPAGTRNHFALDLGLDRDDVTAALDAFGDAVERRIDLATVDDRVFVNNASLGVYATVVQSDAYRDAKLATAAGMLPDLLGPDATGFDLRFTGPDGTRETTADLVLVSNNVYRLERLSGLGTRDRLDAGVLGVVTLRVDRTGDVRALLAAEAGGQLSRYRGFRQWTAREFVIDSGEASVAVGVDGEALRLEPPLRFASLPAALRVRTPSTARTAASRPAGPAAATSALLQVLLGRPSEHGPADAHRSSIVPEPSMDTGETRDAPGRGPGG